jgi:RNA polymerase sigma-70 factor, ECF subfamily
MPSDELQDSELIRRVAAGNAEAFAELFRRRQAHVYRFALHMTASPAIADDVTQDVFLAVMSDAGRYDAARATVIAWLCGIARNHVRRRAERDRPLQPLGPSGREDSDDENDALDALLSVDAEALGDLTRAESIEALREAVLTLPVKYREAVVLCDLQEMTYADAASAIGCAVGTVRSRLHRGRALLAVKLTARAGESVERGEVVREQPSAVAANINRAPSGAQRSTVPSRALRSVRNPA